MAYGESDLLKVILLCAFSGDVPSIWRIVVE